MNQPRWNWEQSDWPNFTYDALKIEPFERKFLLELGKYSGSFEHIGKEDKEILTIEILSESALKTSEIEGEYLSRDSIQSSIARSFGIVHDNRIVPRAEKGIADMLTDVYTSYDQKISQNKLFEWHTLLMSGRSDLKKIGMFRQDIMQIVSGKIYDPKIHYEAVPPKKLPEEVDQFVRWFNATEGKLPILTRAGIAHWYFICIHPFEDGNGRIARAISEKVVSQGLSAPTLIALSHAINKKKSDYYDALKRCNETNLITSWLEYFAQTVLESIDYTRHQMTFIIQKGVFFDTYRNQLNYRQEKALVRMFREGAEGFRGGLSAENYLSITKTSRATATRDLGDLVYKKALRKTGKGKGTRYYLNWEENSYE